MGTAAGLWDIWIDTGGTFTDCIARGPNGVTRRIKVLSSSALRGRVRQVRGPTLRYDAAWDVPDSFLDGSEVVAFGHAGQTARIVASSGSEQQFTTDALLPMSPGDPFEVRFTIEPPVLAAHLATGCSPSRALPPIRMRLATTRATNALLERAGASVAFFTTAGFGDLLLIGDQQRPELFALEIRRSPPLYEQVYEVPERLRANGTVLRPLDLEAMRPAIEDARSRGIECAAVALLHSYRNPVHERALAQALERAGFSHVSTSAAVSPTLKIVPRAETTVVNAYLAPTLEAYIERVESAVSRGGGTLHVLTSAGGLVRGSGYEPKDSLLSGPAGGVVGAAAAGKACGFERILAFDMGGTSTDVSRSDGDHVLRFEHRVGDARVAAPALSIETVAAGGGSVCRVVDGRLRVGPESAGAYPGPACYGAGGPLTLTDVNLLLGRLTAERFGIPIESQAADRALEQIRSELADADGTVPDREVVLEGCRAIANERMADAIRRISIQQGDDPRTAALVAFGGAGGQHACAVADCLGISVVVLPPDAGLLSARGLGAATIERLARRSVMRPLARVSKSLTGWIRDLSNEAISAVVAEGVSREMVMIRQQRVAVRLTGQDATLDVMYRSGRLAADFRSLYRATYGYPPPRRALEVASIQVLAASRVPATVSSDRRTNSSVAPADGDRSRRPEREISSETQQTYSAGTWKTVSFVARESITSGRRVAGPVSIFDPHASLFVEPGWWAQRSPTGAVVARRDDEVTE